MNDPNYMAFLHFPKTYTRALAKYIDRRNDSNGELLAYARLTMDSKCYLDSKEYCCLTLFIIPDLVFRNQIKTDVLNSINYLLEETLTGCSNNPKSISVPIVSSAKIYKYIFFLILYLLLLAV